MMQPSDNRTAAQARADQAAWARSRATLSARHGLAEPHEVASAILARQPAPDATHTTGVVLTATR